MNILQQSARLIPEKSYDKPSSPSKPSTVTIGKSEVTSTLASLFEPQHPWSREGEINMGGFMGGGFLGIRGGIPRLPSFKVITEVILMIFQNLCKGIIGKDCVKIWSIYM